MDGVLQYFKDSYYTDILSVIVAILAFTIVLFKRIEDNLKYFKYYFIIYVLLRFLNYYVFYCEYLNKSYKDEILGIQTYFDYGFTIFEFLLFAQYLKPVVNNNVYKISTCIFLISALLIFVYVQKDRISFSTEFTSTRLFTSNLTNK